MANLNTKSQKEFDERIMEGYVVGMGDNYLYWTKKSQIPSNGIDTYTSSYTDVLPSSFEENAQKWVNWSQEDQNMHEAYYATIV